MGLKRKLSNMMASISFLLKVKLNSGRSRVCLPFFSPHKKMSTIHNCQTYMMGCTTSCLIPPFDLPFDIFRHNIFKFRQQLSASPLHNDFTALRGNWLLLALPTTLEMPCAFHAVQWSILSVQSINSWWFWCWFSPTVHTIIIITKNKTANLQSFEACLVLKGIEDVSDFFACLNDDQKITKLCMRRVPGWECQVITYPRQNSAL